MLGVFSVQCIDGYHQCTEDCILHKGDFDHCIGAIS